MQTMTYLPVSDDRVLKKTIKALTGNGITVEVAENGEEAKQRVLELLPKRAEVMDMTSVTLEEIGLKDELHTADIHTTVKKTLTKLSDKKTKRRLGAAPDYAVGSVHAVTEDGQVLIASNTGSQLPAYAYGAEHVIWVVGIQKIVKDIAEGMQRIYDYILPLEADRARKAYGATGSNVSKILIINKEVNPERIHMIIVKEPLGF
jgi:L-lactate utilization protein LutB